MIHYQLSFINPQAHLVEVTVTAQVKEGQQLVYLPSWIPGSYLVRDFARNILRMSATLDGVVQSCQPQDKDSWIIETAAGELKLHYQIHCQDSSVRSAYFGSDFGFFNGSSLFVGFEQREAEACHLSVLANQQVLPQAWKLALSLPAQSVDDEGFGQYLADDYQALIDYPMLLGDWQFFDFYTTGVQHRFVYLGDTDQRLDVDRFQADLEKICASELAMFGSPPPVEQYLFILMITANGYGGLEHRNSTALICSRGDLPVKGSTHNQSGYQRLLGLCSHEYFHTWNVKRIRPESFAKSGLRTEAYSRLLWAFEGITSYYDDMTLLRSGVINSSDYLRLLAETLTRLQRCQGRFLQSVSDSSFYAWTKFYKQDAHAPNVLVSYYTKGAVVALALDLTIRLQTQGQKSLDDVMRGLWADYLQDGKPVAEHALEHRIMQLCGLDLGDFFEQAIRGTEDVAITELLAEFGVDVTLQAAQGSKDAGGLINTNPATPGYWGWRLQGKGELMAVVAVASGGPAEQAGLQPADVVLAADGLQFDNAAWVSLEQRAQPRQCITLHYFRDGTLRTTELCLQSPPNNTIRLALKEEAPAAQIQRQQQWLNC